MKTSIQILFTLFYGLANGLFATSTDPLLVCWSKHVKPLQNRVLSMEFTETRNEFEHSFEPWQLSEYKSAGYVQFNNTLFIKMDSITRGKKTYYSKTQFNKSELLFQDFGAKELSNVTQSMFDNQKFKIARYTPVQLLGYFVGQNVSQNKTILSEYFIYSSSINEVKVSLYINKKDTLVNKIVTLQNDELFGDVETVYSYSKYGVVNNMYCPTTISISKTNGKVLDEVTLVKQQVLNEAKVLLEKPIEYKILPDKATKAELVTESYSPNIHFISLKHSDDRVMVVEFDDFLLVAEAPLNSANGELIIQEAKKIAPKKPIKYFVFGHFHSHYIGGVRAFIHKGAKIFCSVHNQQYLEYLAQTSHHLSPDSLDIQPKKLLTQLIKDSLNINDGKFEMKLFLIGKQSAHTVDYLIYYFPKEKLLFQDDLIWIKREGAIKKAGARQIGLYNAIKELNLKVDTIIQSWPVSDYGVKTVIPFLDLEQSVMIKE